MKIDAKSSKQHQNVHGLSGEDLIQLFDTHAIVEEILGDREKASRWFGINNPHLGNSSPITLFLRGRGHKVLSFVSNAQEENRPYDYDEDYRS